MIVMKEYKLFANTNPLDSYTLVQVKSSRTMACGLEEAHRRLVIIGRRLKRQGYNAEIQVVETKIEKI